MARPLRIEYEGALYHVMNRGINHQDIFLKNFHREIFLSLLEEISVKFYVEIHCFCLMSNHYHLLIRTPIPNLGKAMRHLRKGSSIHLTHVDCQDVSNEYSTPLSIIF